MVEYEQQMRDDKWSSGGELTAALLTKHGKYTAIAPALLEAGYRVKTIDSFDTDSLGTFTHEIKRFGTMFDSARKKAELAAEIAEVRFGLGSEGSFGPDPYVGVGGWGTELIVWWDTLRGYAIQQLVQGPANFRFIEAQSVDEALNFLNQVGFPTHGVIVGRPGERHFSKDLADLPSLQYAIERGLEHASVWIETDMRAHRNPTRMAMIERCAYALIERIKTPCPNCAAPGFGPYGVIAGAICELCREPTSAARAYRLQCPLCEFQSERPLAETVPPGRCDYCNP